MPSEQTPLVVFSHLPWKFVFQRPQHLLSRFARSRRTLFIEEPVRDSAAEPFWEKQVAPEGVLVCRPHTPAPTPGFSDEQYPYLAPLVQSLVVEEGLTEFDLWFYTPMALPPVAGLRPRAVVYDCMDELSAFRFAPPELLAREADLLRRADVVFTGGPSLFRAKKDRHPNVHCFPSSVDLAHYGKAQAGLPDLAEQAGIARPRLGWFGVIDQRFDIPLLASLAEARPEWQFVMVGPVVKIDPASLPKRENIHYVGQQPYEKLPAFAANWDVCLLPFALNESTRYISPTKTLEYMAAGKPIVSTPITDVVEPYGDIVHVGETPEAFLAGCERALAETPAEAERRGERYRAVLARTSWDSTAAAMEELLEKAAESRAKAGRSVSAARGADGSAATPPVVVIGAGPTGLSAAYHLGEDALLLEGNGRVGGWCRSVVDRGFTFDFAGHIMFSNDPYVHEMYRLLLGDNVHWQSREAWVFSKDVYTRYPFQGALYGLPPEVIRECLVGAIEARFGPLKARETKPAGPKSNGLAAKELAGNGHAGNGHRRNGNGICASGDAKGDGVADCCGDGVLESTARLVRANGKADGAANGDSRPHNFEEFIYKVWGAGIAKHFAIPYNRKLWAVDLKEMETSWLGGRVPLPDLEEMIDGALSPSPKPMGPNARFGYPLCGGFQALMNGFLPHLRGPLRLNARVARVSPSRQTVTLTDSTEIPYEQLVSTMPLPVLVHATGDEAPEEVRRAAAGLRHVSVRCVNLGIGRGGLTDKHWIYYPEDTVFHRIFVQGNASPHCNAPGGFGLTCEITYSPHKPLPCDGEALIRRCVEDCVKVGIIRADDPIWVANQVDMPHAYVVYDHARPRNVQLIREWLAEHNIILAGRYSEWEYYNSDHAFLAGRTAADAVRQRRNARSGALAAV